MSAPAEANKDYSFCKGFFASSKSAPHIRKKNVGIGFGLTGGIQTPSLCGKLRVNRGEDMLEAVDSVSVKRACRRCQDIYEENTK
jgi:hypothetical protein